MKITHKDAPFDHYEAEPDTKAINFVIVGAILGVVVMLCWGILLFGLMMEAVSY